MAAKGRKIRSGDEALELLAAWRTSGERMSVWCAARGLNWYSLSAYQGWARGRQRGPALQLVEVELPVEVPTAPVVRYRIELNSAVVEVDDQFREDSLRRLLRVIASC